MRAHGLDTYYGEGLFLADKQHFDFVYTKVSHGTWNIFSSKSSARVTTEAIFREMRKVEVRGAYAYLLADNQNFHWQKQADAYLESVHHVENNLNIHLHFDVLDIERKYNNTVWKNWLNGYTYPRHFGSMIYEAANYITKNRNRPLLLYMDESTWLECFSWYGYSFQKDYPLLIASYRFNHWEKSLEDVPRNVETLPSLPTEAEDWRIWQYSDKFQAGDFFPDSMEADVNVYNGTLKDMVEWLSFLSPENRQSFSHWDLAIDDIE